MGRGEDGSRGPSRGSGPAWQSDEKGRRFYDERGRRVYESQGDRDDALEERYTRPHCCGLDCCGSVLACVGSHGEELAEQFMVWVSAGRRNADDRETLHEWCVSVFGDRLYRSAFGVLRFWVAVKRFGDPYHRLKRKDNTPLPVSRVKNQMKPLLAKP